MKKKYGRRISWADLMVFAGNRALETMGFTTFGFAGGRPDVWEPDEDVYWGPERAWLGDERHRGVRELENPLAADQMGLIYVNPEGPNTVPDPLASARDIRETFRRMGMNDEETVALIAGGHTFGKTHGAADPDRYLGPEPEGAPLEEQGLGWRNSYGTGKGRDTITSGLEGTWTPTPTRWDNSYFENLFGFEWDLELSPAGLWQWIPRDGGGAGTVPDAHDPSKTHAPTILTTDLALRVDPIYEPISRRFLEHPDQLADAFARAWFKLTHLDMGPIQRYLGPLVPQETLLWQDPVPAVDHELVGPADIATLKEQILASELTISQLVATAWASASTFRGSDKRGGANGARIRLATPTRLGGQRPRQPGAGATHPRAHPGHLQRLPDRGHEDLTGRPHRARRLRRRRTGRPHRRRRRAGPLHPRTHRRHPGADRHRVLRRARTHRGRLPQLPREGQRLPSEYLLVDRANLLTLSAPEMTVLVGGLRVLGANTGAVPAGRPHRRRPGR